MEKQSKNMFQSITKIFELSQSFRYELLFMISMCLYHSTQFYLSTGHEKSYEIFVLSFLNSFNLEMLEISGIIITLITLFLLVTKTFLLRKQNYSLQILQKVIFPIQIYIAISVFRSRLTNNNQNSQVNNKILEIFFLIILTLNSIIVIIKNLTNFLRYGQIKQKGLNRLERYQYFFLTSKIIGSIVFAIFFQNQTLIYFFFMAGINILLNISFMKQIFYEQSKIQYLYLVTQFYQWIPLTNILFYQFSFSKTVILSYNVLAFISYLLVGLTKPQVLTRILEKKYTSLLLQHKKQSRSFETTNKSSINPTIAKISLFMDIFLSQNSNDNKIRWSNWFKNTLIQNLIQNSSKINSHKKVRINQRFSNDQSLTNSDSNQSKTINSQQKTQNIAINNDVTSKLSKMLKNKEKSQDKVLVNHSKQLLQQKKNYFRIFQQNKQIICQLIWRYIQQTSLLTDLSSQSLRYFVCYNLPDLNNVIKYRIFYSYYLNNAQQTSFFNKLSNDICYNYLLEKTELNKRTHSIQAELIQNSFTKQTFFKTSCLTEQKSYLNPKFNDLVLQSQIFHKFIESIRHFYQNQVKYLKIFENIEQNKQNIREYYEKRRHYRLQTAQLIREYQNLGVKKSNVMILMHFIEQCYLNKNIQMAYSRFQQAIQNIVNQNKIFFRKKHQNIDKSHTNKRTFKKIKESKLIQTQNLNLTCVVSGIRQVGHIQISCSKFKDLMQIQIDQKQYLNHLNINSLILPIWRQRHSQLMTNFAIYEKPIDHSRTKCFIISRKGNFIYQVKFEIYFFIKLQQDLLLVIDIQYQKIDFIQIADESKNILFSHGRKKKNNHNFFQSQQSLQIIYEPKMKSIKSIAKLKNQNDEKNRFTLTNVFDNTYNLNVIKKDQLNHSLSQSYALKARNMIRFSSTALPQQENKRQQKVLQQLKFNRYKLNFNPHKNTYLFLKGIVTFSNIFFWVSFQIFINVTNSHNQQIFTFIKDKSSIQNQFIAFDAYSSIDIGILYNLVKGNLAFELTQETEKIELQSYVMQSLSHIIEQILQKSSQSQFDDRYSLLTQSLYNPLWIQGWNKTFIAHSLQKQLLFYDTLDVFVDLNNFTQLFQDNKQITLTKQLSQTSQQKILQNIIATFDTNKYNFGPNGVIQSISVLESQQLHTIYAQRQINMAICFGGFLATTITSIFVIILFKKLILQKFNHSVRTSKQFRMKFAFQLTELKSLIENLQTLPQQKIFSKVKPFGVIKDNSTLFKPKKFYQNINRNLSIYEKYESQSIKSKQNFKKSDLINQNKRILQKSQKFDEVKLIQKQSKLNLLSYLFQSILFPSIRFFILAIFIITFYKNSSNNIKIMENYSQGLDQLSKINAALIQGFNMNLYMPKLKQTSIEKPNTDTFYYLIDQIQQIDKIKMIKHLFPLNQLIVDKILYKNVCLELPQIQCNDVMKQRPRSFLQTSNRLMLDLVTIFRHLIQQNANYSLLKPNILQTYLSLSQIVYITDKITDYSHNQLQKIMNNQIELIFALISIFLIIQLIFGAQHFDKFVSIFNQEYLNLGTWQNLQKEEGFQFYVNQSKKQNQSLIQIKQNQKQSYQKNNE